jgi:hypothetical protein
MEMPKIGISLEENHLREYVALSTLSTLYFHIISILFVGTLSHLYFLPGASHTSAGVRQVRQRPEWNDSPHLQLSPIALVSPLKQHYSIESAPAPNNDLFVDFDHSLRKQQSVGDGGALDDFSPSYSSVNPDSDWRMVQVSIFKLHPQCRYPNFHFPRLR